VAQGESAIAFGICVISKYVLPLRQGCLSEFVNMSFIVNQKLFNQCGSVVIGCALVTTLLAAYFLSKG
jgi:hypothetical protein